MLRGEHPQPITILNENDVLYGRGSGISQFMGNKRFRDVCEARKDEYNSAVKNKIKGKIAEQVFDQIHSRGGRFLQLQDSSTDELDNLDEIWVEVDEKKALEKVKQTLRQHVTVSLSPRLKEASLQEARDQTSGSIIRLLEGNDALVSSGVSGVSDASLNEYGGLIAALLAAHCPPPDAATSLLLPALSPTLFGSAGMVVPRLSLLQSATPLTPYLRALLSEQVIPSANITIQQQQAQLAASSMLTATLFPNQGNRAVPWVVNDGRLQPISPHITLQGQQADTVSYSRDGHCCDGVATSEGRCTAATDLEGQVIPPSLENMNTKSAANASVSSITAANEDKVSEYLQSVLQLSGLSRFTTNHEKERASMADKEKAVALAEDVFGVDTHKKKRVRRYLNPEKRDCQSSKRRKASTRHGD